MSHCLTERSRISIVSSLAYDEILTSYRDIAIKEYETLRLVPKSKIYQFIQAEASQLVRVSIELMQNFGKLPSLPEV